MTDKGQIIRMIHIIASLKIIYDNVIAVLSTIAHFFYINFRFYALVYLLDK